MRIALAVVLFAFGCDTKATASDPQGAPRVEQKSREYESCAASAHCADELRCFDNTCRRIARSAVGDYFAASGAAARAKGDTDAAVAAYEKAIGHYDSEKIPVPPDVDCAYGAALVSGSAKAETLELGARVLHRCILAVPAASALRDRALASLTALEPYGLDPLLLGAPKPADLYLKGPVKPATDKLAVTVTALPKPTRSFQTIVDKLTSVEARPAMLACWEAYRTAANKDALAVTIGIKNSYRASEYEDEAGTFSFKLDPAPAAGATPEAAAEACVAGIVEPTLKAAKLAEAFATKLTITIK
ncbi:MAG: hypothetical protein AB7O24_24355 [Kofleriaceae bacterium]